MSRLLLIHLSDLHIVDNNSFSDERKTSINNIIQKEIVNHSIEETILLFTGDMTWSGKREQFDLTYKYIDSIIKYIKTLLPSTFVGFYCCPGNHDIDFDVFDIAEGEVRDRYLIAKNEFFYFAQKQKLFLESKEYHIGTFKVSNSKIKIDFFSINSTYGSRKIDADKGLHFLSPETLKAMRDFRTDNRTILLIHHFEDYFDESSSLELRNFIKEKCDFVFFGHTHIAENGTYIIDDKKIGISRGGALHDKNGSIFSVTLLCIDNTDYITRVYEWDLMSRSYMFLKEITNKYNIKTNVDIDFYTRNNSQVMDFPNAKLEEIFVFPDLLFEQNKERNISSFDKFVEILSEDKKYIIVKGFEKSGKTFISRYLFNYYAKNNGNPLLISRNYEKKNFESNIIISLSKYNENSEKKIDIPIALLLLESLGHTCFKNSKNIFAEQELISIVNERNMKSNLKKHINFTDYHKAFLTSRIICEMDTDRYAFISNSYLSYFAARYLKRLITLKRREEFSEELQYLSDNISIDLCGDILLFLCYQTGDMSIIEHLVHRANDFYKNKIELDLNVNNMSYLFSSSLPRRTIPSEEDKRALKKKQEQKEQTALSTREKNDFERDAKSVVNTVFDGFRFVELICKILPDFIENIENDELIMNCVNSLYEYSHRFLYQLFLPLDEAINKEKKYLDQLDKYDDLLEQDLNDFEVSSTAISYQLIRIVYNSIARFSSTDSTIKALDNYDNKSILYTIENLYMHAYIEGETQFINSYKQAKNILDNTYSKRNFLYNLIEDTFFLYLIKYPNFRYFGEMQGLIDKTFLQEEKGKSKSSKKFINKIRKPK